MTKLQKFGFGVLGGMCLVLAKFLVSGLFTADSVSNIGLFIGAGMTLALAGIWTMAEDEEKYGKLIRFGFAAPGLLMLLATQGAKLANPPIVSPGIDQIPELEAGVFRNFNLIPKAHADSPSPEPALQEKIPKITRDNLRGGVGAGVRAFVGLPYVTPTYAYAVGKTANLDQAKKVLSMLQADKIASERNPKIVQLGATSQYLVILGKPASAESVYRDSESLKQVLKTMSDSKRLPAESSAAAILSKGSVVNLSTVLSESGG